MKQLQKLFVKILLVSRTRLQTVLSNFFIVNQYFLQEEKSYGVDLKGFDAYMGWHELSPGHQVYISLQESN